jgi:hypothetical protein
MRAPFAKLAAVRLLRCSVDMSACSFATPPRHSIAQTERGWVLVIQNDHFSVMQVFSTASSARRAMKRMLEFFHTMSAQPPRSRQAA